MTGHFKIITDSYEYESHNRILNSSKTSDNDIKIVKVIKGI